MKKYRISKCNDLVVYMLVIFFFFLIGEVGAATYYVSPNGSDSNNGSMNAPFKTIQKAAIVVNPGDTVIVKDGTYTDTDGDDNVVNIKRAGSSSAWITFKAENKWGAKINGQSNATDYCVNFASGSAYIRFEDFEIYGCSHGGVHSNSTGHHIVIYRNKIHDIGRMCFVESDENITGKDAVDIGTLSHHITIDSNFIYHTGRLRVDLNGCSSDQGHNNDHGMYIRGSDIDIINNVMDDFQSGYAMTLKATNCSGCGDRINIINNTVRNAINGRGIGFVGENNDANGINDAVVQNNIIVDMNYNDAIFFNPTSGVQSMVIKNNLTYNCALLGSSLGSYASRFTISSNIENQNPQFVDMVKSNFHLESNSPAINKGLSFKGRTKDADGNSIIGVPDIGAFEAGSGDTQDTTPPAPPAIIEVK